MPDYDDRGKCTECKFYRADEKSGGWCVKQHRPAKQYCWSFKITDEASAKRYVNARRTSRRAGIGYDADLVRFHELPERVQQMITEELKGRVRE